MATAFLIGGFFAHFLKFGITKKLNSFPNASHLFPHNLPPSIHLFSYCYAPKKGVFFVSLLWPAYSSHAAATIQWGAFNNNMQEGKEKRKGVQPACGQFFFLPFIVETLAWKCMMCGNTYQVKRENKRKQNVVRMTGPVWGLCMGLSVLVAGKSATDHTMGKSGKFI